MNLNVNVANVLDKDEKQIESDTQSILEKDPVEINNSTDSVVPKKNVGISFQVASNIVERL